MKSTTSEIGVIVGGGSEQIPFIRATQKLGYRVVALDSKTECQAATVADYFEPVDFDDTNRVSDIVDRYGVSFVVPSPIGSGLWVQARISSQIGGVGPRPSTVRYCLDKVHFRSVIEKCAIPLRKQVGFTSIFDVDLDAVRSIGFPLIVKPRCGSGSKGVRLVDSEYEFQRMYTMLARDHHELDWIIEEYVEGNSLGVDAIIESGHVVWLCLRDKVMSPPPYRVEIEYRTPSIYQSLFETIKKYINSICVALEIDNSVVHADIVVDNCGLPHIIEMSPRPSGLSIWPGLLCSCYGVSVIGSLVEFYASGRYILSPERLRPTILHFWATSSGTVKIVPPENLAETHPCIRSWDCKLQIGDKYNQPTSVGDLLSSGHVLISADSWRTVEETLHICKQGFLVN